MLMTGYTILAFGTGDEVKGRTGDKVGTGGETGRNNGHPKPHGRFLKPSFGPECVPDLNSCPLSPELILTWD